MITGIINIKPMSVNEAYTGRRFKTDRYRAYADLVYWHLRNAVMPAGCIKLTIDWYVSNLGADVDNPAKPFIDILQKRYGFNDKNIYQLILTKKIISKGNERIEFKIERYDQEGGTPEV